MALVMSWVFPLSIARMRIFSSLTRNGLYLTVFPVDGKVSSYEGVTIVGNGIMRWSVIYLEWLCSSWPKTKVSLESRWSDNFFSHWIYSRNTLLRSTICSTLVIDFIKFLWCSCTCQWGSTTSWIKKIFFPELLLFKNCFWLFCNSNIVSNVSIVSKSHV